MDAALARWLTSDAAAPALAAAAAETDPSSLGAATRLRGLVTPEQAAAVLTQAQLRRRGVAKFGARAGDLFLTPDGLEQATRAPVAARRAARFTALLSGADGAGSVVDLGCGLGADALALQQAGLEVLAVERDEVTAILASANLGRCVRVADAEAAWPALAAPGGAVFCDPARRTASGRSWRMEDLSPPWAFVTGLLDGARVACVKLGPGVPHRVIPPDVEAEFVSDEGSVVECALWAGPGTTAGRRAAVVDGAELEASGRFGPAAVGSLGEYLYEPDGAVVRAGLVDEFAGLVRAHRVAEDIAYLTADAHLPTPFATVFRVLEVLPYSEKVLRTWVREHHIGTLEIKKRGIDVDPAVLRRRLKPHGQGQATVVMTPTATGAVAVVCRRLA